MNEITFGQAWSYGGALMWVLSFFSVAALALVIYLWYSQRRGICVPGAVDAVRKAKEDHVEDTSLELFNF